MFGTSGPGQSDEKDSQAGRVQNEANIVDFLDLLPARLLKVILWARRWVVEEDGPDHTQDSVDDANIIAPSPAGGGVCIQCRRDERSGDRPWYDLSNRRLTGSLIATLF